MANTILHKRSSSTGAAPTAGQLSAGELALNTADGKVFMKNAAGTVVEVSYRDARVDSRVQTLLGAVSYDILPDTDNIRSLGSATHMWKDVYVGPGSLYVNGQKVLEEDSGNIIVSCDINQNLVLQTSGSGDIELDPTGTGVIAFKGPVQFEAGVNITTSDGNPVSFGNSIKVDAITSKSANTDLTLTGAGTGKVYINDNAEVSGNMVVGGNLTVSGTTTTVNSETISLADNIIDLNSNFTTGAPTENAGLRILRGDESNVQVRWNESSDVWQITNDGSAYSNIVGHDATQTLTNKTFSLGSNTVTGTLAQFNTAVTDADFASLAGTETLTNKTIAAGSNTISGLTNANLSGTAGITNANLANSAVTIGSTSVSLGATATTIAGLTSVTSTGFTGALTGNADTATKWATARTITLGGDLSGSVSLDGSANVTLTATVAGNTVALGTDTTGNYMVDVTAGSGISVTHTPGEGSTATVAIDSTVATLTGSQTLTNKTIALGSNTVSGTLAQFNTAVTDADLVSLAGTETLTNKTLTAPNISGLVITDGSIIIEGATADGSETTLAFTDPTTDRTITFPDITGTVVTTGDTGSVTNTMLAGSIANAKLANSTISGKALGTNLDALTISTGLSGTSYNGSGAVTIAIDSTVATLTGSQTLTNKTLTAPTISSPTVTSLFLNDASIIFEGATANDFETTLTVTDPTADRTITLPDATGTVALTNNKLSAFAATTSAELAGVISDETGSGALVFASSPTLVTPTLGVASATSVNKVAITAPATGSTLTIADGKTLTASNTLTFTGTDSSSVAFGAGGTVAYTANKLSAFAATTSAELAGVISDETGSGSLVFSASPTFTGTVGAAAITTTGNVVVGGDLTVNGTTTTINSTTIAVDDKNIILGDVATPTDTTADGGGITLKGATDKTFNWVDSTDAWTSSEHLRLAAGKNFVLAGSTSGTVTLATPAAAGATTITFPATTGTVITTGDSGTVTSTMIADGTIVNADINASAAIAVSKLAASTISGVTLGNNLNALTISTGLSGTSYNGSGAVTIAIDSTVATLTGSQTLTNKTISLGSNTLSGTSAQFAAACSDETGSGALTFATSPTFTTSIDGGATFGAFASSTTLTEGYTGTAASTHNIATGAVANATTKTINIGTGGAAGSTTTITIGAASGTSTVTANGALRATGEVTAYYSDKRLKENIKPIENALAKTMSLHGVTYNANDVAAGFGYTNKDTQVGLLAQDVQAVLPEVVVPAPFDVKIVDGKEVSKSGEDYITVKYEKIVALLVEAIKELNDKVESLEAQLGGSKSL